ncbi:MAG: DUF2304 domain-containing protein [Magnetococcales bacterium]|nr:DUF2304 domain-containing protein [Magnetococcales bacterium]
MTPKQYILLIVLGLLSLILVTTLIQKNRIRIRYSILWVAISLFFLTIPLFVNFYTAVGELIGILSPISLFFFGATIGLFLLSLQFTLALSVAFHQRKDTVQQTALLEERIEKLEKQLAIQQQDGAQ